MQPYARADIIPLRSGEELLKSFLQLLPTGQYWEWKKYPDSNFYKWLLGIFEVLAIDYNKRFYNLWVETDILRTVEDLPIWEQNVGIPDELLGTAGLTLERRRYNVISRYFKRQLISRLDYIDFLASAGYVLGVDYVDILNGIDGYLLYGGLYNAIYNIEILTQTDTDVGCVYLILNDGNLDNQKIINILIPVLPVNSTFKQIYIV